MKIADTRDPIVDSFRVFLGFFNATNDLNALAVDINFRSLNRVLLFFSRMFNSFLTFLLSTSYTHHLLGAGLFRN